MHTFSPSKFIFANLYYKINILIHKKESIRLFVVSLFTVTKNWKHQQENMMKELWHIHATDYHTATTKNKLDLSALNWRDMHGILLSKKKVVE